MASKRRRSSSRNADSIAPQAARTQQPPAPAPEPVTEEVLPRPSVTARVPVHEQDRIGDILRRVREHREEELEEISDYLRIRPSFLFALENSRYEDLPADAYVIGFLRTYALYLGLDGKGAIDQYRREMAGRRRKPQLSMPQPMSEGRTPTIAILVGAAIACLFIYGLWYGLSTPEREIIEKPLPLPASIAEPAAPTPASEALAATTAGDLLLQTTSGASETVSTLAATAATKEEEAAATADAAAQTAAAEKKVEPAAEPAPNNEPQRFGKTGKTRLVIKADKESWILITDNKGVTIFDRTLKPGESYGLLTGKGYFLTTGNAAGLILIQDDIDLPRFTGSGRVVRGINLDPDKLKARAAKRKKEPKPEEEQQPTDATPTEAPAD